MFTPNLCDNARGAELLRNTQLGACELSPILIEETRRAVR